MTTCDYCGLDGELRTAAPDGQSLRLCGPCTVLADDDRSLRVSPLGRDDLELVLAWRSNPDVYRHFHQQDGPLDWESHVTWYETRGSDRHDFVIHYDGRRVGVVSLDSDDEVGIYLGDVSARGNGIATRAIRWLCDRFPERGPLVATVHEDNTASQRLFERCDFDRDGVDGSWLRYVYDP
jgi:RimJ/RimL family protein N-acetyltransferase